MRIDVAFTYSTTARRKGDKGGGRKGDFRGLVAVEVAEASVAECPVAVVAGDRAFRNVGGRLAERVPLPEGVRDARQWLAARASGGDCRQFDAFAPANLTSEDHPALNVRKDCVERTSAVESMCRRARDLAFLGNDLWQVSEDPVLLVGLGADGVSVTVAGAVEIGSDAVRQFRLDRPDAALAFLEATRPGDAVVLPAYDVIDPRALTFDARSAALRHAARRLCGSLRDAVGHRDYGTLSLYARAREMAEGRPDPERPGLDPADALADVLPGLCLAVGPGAGLDEATAYALANHAAVKAADRAEAEALDEDTAALAP